MDALATLPAVSLVPLATVVTETYDPDMRTLNCFACGTVTIHMRTADGFACSACDTVQTVIEIEDFYGDKKGTLKHDHRKTL